MRTVDELNAEYSQLCIQLGSLEATYQINSAKLLQQISALNDEMKEVRAAETTTETTAPITERNE